MRTGNEVQWHENYIQDAGPAGDQRTKLKLKHEHTLEKCWGIFCTL